MNKKNVIRNLLLLVLILQIISGYGMTEYRIVNNLTLGLFEKATYFKIHSNLVIVFVILVILHIYPMFKQKQK
jgi:thiosulfate reductase cytochrome b subunit